MPKLCAHRLTGGASCWRGVRGPGLSAAGDSGCPGEEGDAVAAERLGTDLQLCISFSDYLTT